LEDKVPKRKPGGQVSIELHENTENYVQLLAFYGETCKNPTQFGKIWHDKLSQSKYLMMSPTEAQEFTKFQKKFYWTDLPFYFRLTPLFTDFLKRYCRHSDIGYLTIKHLVETSIHIFEDLWFNTSDRLIQLKIKHQKMCG
jgi:hypothetical protein